jgi:hypothetical protein
LIDGQGRFAPLGLDQAISRDFETDQGTNRHGGGVNLVGTR